MLQTGVCEREERSNERWEGECGRDRVKRSGSDECDGESGGRSLTLTESQSESQRVMTWRQTDTEATMNDKLTECMNRNRLKGRMKNDRTARYQASRRREERERVVEHDRQRADV